MSVVPITSGAPAPVSVSDAHIERSELAVPHATGMAAYPALAWDEERGEVTVRVETGRELLELQARLDRALDPAVVRTAVQRGERLILQKEGGEWVALGALRTCATPGVDRAEEYAIEAQRIHLRAEHELTLVSGVVEMALRATGHVETIARNITTRASAVHKIIGRMLHLN